MWRNRRIIRALSVVAAGLGILVPGANQAETAYTYDQLGRATGILYDDGACATVSYDANGNRVALSNLTGAPVWGARTWRCFRWTAQ